MSNLYEPRRVRPNTYLLPDGLTPRELERLRIQDEMYTDGMGGTLPEQPDPTGFHRVLDVGSGSGCWLIAAAQAYPQFTKLIGVDISEEAIDYARKQAEIHNVSERVEFRLMDALQVLTFPDNSFDLVNQRFGMSYVRSWDWPQALAEYRRVTRPGGVVRITEVDVLPETTSSAQMAFHQLLLKTLYQAGYLPKSDQPGLTDELAPLLKRCGLKDVQTHSWTLEFRSNTPQGQRFHTNIQMAAETLVPFIRKWGRLPADYDDLLTRLDQEMVQPDFTARMHMLTAWGTN